MNTLRIRGCILGLCALAVANGTSAQASPAQPAPLPDTPSAPSEVAATPPTTPPEATAPAQDAVEPSAEPAMQPASAADVATPPTAPARPVAKSAAPAAANDADTMIVTGSRIRTSGFSPAASVQVIDRKQLEYSNARNLTDVVRYLTASASSDTFGRAFAGGATAVNLHGLGPSATLVLVNGRRIMPSPRGFGNVYYDINAIPVAAVERIEVLRGGASAIYGSDAIAGVVNIITRNDWEGLHVEVGAQTDDDLTQHGYDGSLAVGGRGERFRISLGLSYDYHDVLLGSDRDWTRGHTTDVLGNPGSFYVPSQMGIVPDANCNDVKGSMSNAQGLCTYDFGSQSDLVGERDSLATYGFGEYDLTNHTSVFTELGYMRTGTQSVVTPSLGVLPQVLVPANHVDNPFGEDVYFVGRALPAQAGAGATGTSTSEDQVRVVLGLRGDLEGVADGLFLEPWTWELSGSYTASRLFGLLPQEVIVDNLRAAINSCSDRSDLSRCFNPFYSAYTGEGTPNSAAVIDFVMGKLMWTNDSRLLTAEAGATGPLFELPGGDLALAFGGQFREERRTGQSDAISSQIGYGFFFGSGDTRAKRAVGSGYAELMWPFYDGITVQTAGRVEDHEDVATTVSPSAGIVLLPAEIAGLYEPPSVLRSLRLRANVVRAFRAPSLFESAPGFSTTINAFRENGLDLYRAVKQQGNPSVKPEQAWSLSAGVDVAPVPELMLTADYWYYDYTDRLQQDNAIKIFQTDPNDPRVMRDSTGALQSVSTRTDNQGSVTTDGFDLGAMLRTEIGKAGTLGVGAEVTYMLRYEIPRSDQSTLTLNDGTNTVAAKCDATICNVVGMRNATNPVAASLPRLRLNVPVSFEKSGHALSATLHFIGAIKDDQNPDMETGELPQVDSFTTLDLQYGYTIDDWLGKQLTPRIGVTNLLDTDPPFVNTPWAYVTDLHDPRGRIVYARVIAQL